MTIVGFWSPLFLLLVVEKQKKEFPSLVDFSEDIKKRERRNGIASDWVEQRSHIVFPLFLSYSLLISSYTKDDEASKKSVFARVVDEKWVGSKDVDHDHFLGTNRGLACVSSCFLIGSQRSAKRHREKGRKTLVVSSWKKKNDDNDEKRIFSTSFWPFHALAVFSISLSLSVSLLAIYEEKQINRFILQIPSSFFFGAAREVS
jgi:hypothetical protein